MRFVLLRPRNPENLGAVARVLRNFDFEDWSLVDTRTFDFQSARRVAVHAEGLLDKPMLAHALEEAVADCAWVVGTSSRRVPGVVALDARGFATEAAKREASGQRVALVFGDERSGLTNAEVLRCHALVRLPTGGAQPSVNLAQTVAILAHELRVAQLPRRKVAPRAVATDAEMVKLEALFGKALTVGGFLDAKAPRHALRELMRALQRAQLSPREWRLWMAAAGKLAGVARR